MLRLATIVVLVMTGSCSGSSGNNDAGAGAADDSAPHCFPISNGKSCLCSKTALNSLSECSASSVAPPGQGYCCRGPIYCGCDRVECTSLSAIGECECGRASDYDGTRVDACPHPSGGICCLDTKGGVPYTCHCSGSVTTCLAGETEVPSCSLADVMKCEHGDTTVTRCK